MENVSIFPSVNLISVSHNKSIVIYDKDLSIIQEAHTSLIYDVQIKNEENFVHAQQIIQLNFGKKNEENIFLLKK